MKHSLQHEHQQGGEKPKNRPKKIVNESDNFTPECIGTTCNLLQNLFTTPFPSIICGGVTTYPEFPPSLLSKSLPTLSAVTADTACSCPYDTFSRFTVNWPLLLLSPAKLNLSAATIAITDAWGRFTASRVTGGKSHMRTPPSVKTSVSWGFGSGPLGCWCGFGSSESSL